MKLVRWKLVLLAPVAMADMVEVTVVTAVEIADAGNTKTFQKIPLFRGRCLCLLAERCLSARQPARHPVKENFLSLRIKNPAIAGFLIAKESVSVDGIEPSASVLSGQRSTTELHAHIIYNKVNLRTAFGLYPPLAELNYTLMRETISNLDFICKQ